MATMRRADSKGALGRQRAELRRGARGKAHVGDETGARAGRAAELERVREMQLAQHARELAEERLERRTEEAPADVESVGHGRSPWLVIFGDLVVDSVRLARTLVLLPFRVAGALRGRHPHASEA